MKERGHGLGSPGRCRPRGAADGRPSGVPGRPRSGRPAGQRDPRRNLYVSPDHGRTESSGRITHSASSSWIRIGTRTPAPTRPSSCSSADGRSRSLRPPRSSTAATISSSINAWQSQRTLPSSVGTRAVAGIAKPGLQPMPSTPGSSSRISHATPQLVERRPLLASFRDEPTRSRRSDTLGRLSDSGYCVPHVAHRKCSTAEANLPTDDRVSADRRLPLRGRSVLCERAARVLELLPLHALPATHWDGGVGVRADRAGLTHHPLRRGAAPLVRPSRPRLLEVFCSACGGHLWSQSQEDPEIKSIRLGAFDSDPGSGRRPAVRRLRGVVGADPGRRAPPLSGASQRLSYCTSDPGQVSVRR